jgi:hypothetical protein
MVGSANDAPELGASSRTISVNGPCVGAVDVGDDTLNSSVHVQLSAHHSSFQALADSGASVSYINASTFALIQRRCPGTYLHTSGKAFLANYGRKSRCVGAIALPITLGTFTTTIKLYIVEYLVSEFILGGNYLYALRAIMDFDHEVLRLHHRTTGMRATVPFTNTEHLSSHVSAVHAIETLPLEPYEQRLITARMPLDRIDRPGVLTQIGAKSLEKAAIANGNYEKVPKHSSILIANPTHDHIAIHAGTRIGSIQATNIDVTDALPIGALFMENNYSWCDFDQTATRATATHHPGNTATIATVRLQPPDESISPVTWKLQTDSEQNTDLSPTQRTLLGKFILPTSIGTPV